MRVSNSQIFEELSGFTLPKGILFHQLGLINSSEPGTLSFAESKAYTEKGFDNPNIVALLLPENLALSKNPVSARIIPCENPKELFYRLFNRIANEEIKAREPSKIDSSALIAPSAVIAPYGVTIGANTRIMEGVTIENGVDIGNHCLIEVGTVIGRDGFEFKRINGIQTRIIHNRKVLIGDNVELGHHCVVDKGIFDRDTRIDDDSKIDSHSHIAHATQIGRNNLIASGVLCCGSVTIGNDCWIGPKSVISNGLKVGNKAYVGIGSVVVVDVDDNSRVFGNPASSNYHRYLKIIYE